MAALLSCRGNSANLRRALQRSRNCSAQGATLMDQRTLKDAASNVQTLAARKYRRATTVVDGYVSDNPWKSIGIATAMGVLIGFLAAKR
jgi:ElaB/YqjD/DUF883 family membrane-anchored ribosome-binding protein